MRSCLLIFLLFSITCYAQIDSLKLPGLQMHSQGEYEYDSPASIQDWSKQAHRMNVSFATTDEAWFSNEVPSLDTIENTCQATGWRGERINVMVLVWSPDTLQQIRFTLHDLKSAKGETINKNALRLDLVRYVLSNYPYNAKDLTCDAGPVDKGWLMPDRLEPFSTFDLPGRSTRPVWLSIDIPAQAKPGTYTTTIDVNSVKHSRKLHLTVDVQWPLLPAPHDWKFRLDLWQNPWVIAHYYNVKPWSAEHKMLLAKHLKLYADAGGKFITTYAVHSPWADATYRVDEAMIEWIKLKNKNWKFDYSIFDQYVQLAMQAGIDKAITIYTPIPWGDRFRYLDESTGNYVYETWPPASDTFRMAWNTFLTDLRSHLEKKGWFQKTYLGVNENPMDQTLAAIKVIKAHSKDWKITYAGDWHPELDSLVDDYCSVFGKEPTIQEVDKRISRTGTSTFYVCCTPPKPNTFLCSPPVEGRFLGWYALGHNYNGFLRWAYDSWTADPTRDARHVYWPAGDCFLVYPGAESSIRFEKLREGITDYEKVRILREKLSKEKQGTVLWELLKNINEIAKGCVSIKDYDERRLQRMLSDGRLFIDQLTLYIELSSHALK